MPRLITAAMAQRRPGSLFSPLICTGPSSSTGGTFTIDQTGNDGKTLDATVTWTCP
jgi:hypothetical protein